jgi:hexulose-6-phosphate isomerase
MERREFLQKSSCALGGLALGSCSTAKMLESSLETPLKYKSLKFGMIDDDLTVMDKFKLIKDLGFHGVELNWPNELSEKEILAARDKTGIHIPGTVNSVHWKKQLSNPDPTVRKECVDATIEALHKTKLYGGDTVLLVPGVVNKEMRYDQAWDRSTEEIKKILPTAEKTGVKIAIENVWNNFLISPVEAKSYVDQFDSDMIGWYMDIGNIVRYGWPDQWIRILGERIFKVDIKDYSRKKQVDEGIWEGFKVKLGDGDSDWTAVNKALKDIGYSGWGSAEVSGGNRERLLEISERMDKLYSM